MQTFRTTNGLQCVHVAVESAVVNRIASLVGLLVDTEQRPSKSCVPLLGPTKGAHCFLSPLACGLCTALWLA